MAAPSTADAVRGQARGKQWAHTLLMKRPLAINHAVIRHLCSAGREAPRRQLEVGVGRHSAQLRQLRSSTAPVETPSRKANPMPTNETAKADTGKSVEVGKSPVKTKASYVMPANWHAKESTSTGERYYFNSVTGESTWRHPGEDVALILLDAKWRAFILYMY